MAQGTMPAVRSSTCDRDRLAELEAALSRPCTARQAHSAVVTMLGRFPQRPPDMLDELAYIAGLEETLRPYPDCVVDQVAHPIHGVPGRTRFWPAPVEVRECCDELLTQLRRDVAEIRHAIATAERARLAPPPAERKPTARERARCDARWRRARAEILATVDAMNPDRRADKPPASPPGPGD